MRRILIDYARRRSAVKRGGPLVRVPLRDDAAVVEAEVTRMLSIDEALRGLEQHDARMGAPPKDTGRAIPNPHRAVLAPHGRDR